MNAPDKIYIPVYPNDYLGGTYLGYDWFDTPLDNVEDNIEYIRKDALMDAIKLAYGKVSMNSFDCSEAFEELINKINSLKNH